MFAIDAVKLAYCAWRDRLRGEPEGIAYLLGLDLRGQTCLDIGAREETLTWWLCRQVGRRGAVVAFEPQPERYRDLCLLRPALGRNVIVEPLGLSSSAGDSVETIDRYLLRRPLPPVGLIKCDVAEHEEDVFRGAEQTLRRQRPRLLFACHPRTAAQGTLFGYFETLGYAGFFFWGGGLHELEYAGALAASDNGWLTRYVFVSRDEAHRVPVMPSHERRRLLREVAEGRRAA